MIEKREGSSGFRQEEGKPRSIWRRKDWKVPPTSKGKALASEILISFFSPMWVFPAMTDLPFLYT